jgi:hypothetical protein
MRQRTFGPRLARFAVAASACFGAGCEEDAPGAVATEPVTIQFAAVVGDLPWRCGQLYQQLGVTPAAVQPQDLRFFVHGFELVRADGSAEPVVYVAYLPRVALNTAQMVVHDDLHLYGRIVTESLRVDSDASVRGQELRDPGEMVQISTVIVEEEL